MSLKNTNKRPNLTGGANKLPAFSACYNGREFTQKHRTAKGGLGEFVLYSDLPKEYTETHIQNSTIQWIPFLDEKNNLYNELFGMAQTSPTNAAILSKKIRMVTGDGFSAQPRKGVLQNSGTPKKELTPAQLQNLELYLSEYFTAHGDTIDCEYAEVVNDYVIFGNAYVQIIKGVQGEGEQQSKAYYQCHVPFMHGRVKRKSEGDEYSKFVGISDKWNDGLYNGTNVPPNLVIIPIYPNFAPATDAQGKVIDKDGIERSIVHIKDYQAGFQYYGVPNYIACRLYAELEYRIAKYNQSQFNNGFMPSGILQIFGAATQPEADAAMIAAHEKFTGAGNEARLLVQVMANAADAAKYTPMNAMQEGGWLELSKISRDNIIVAHEWSPSLAGVSEAGILGSNQQVRLSFEVIQNTVIKPMQNAILRQWLNKTILDAAEFLSTDFGNVELTVLNVSPVSFAGDIDINAILDDTEKRALVGYEARKTPITTTAMQK